MIEEILLNTEEKMETSVSILTRELASIRTGRASASLLEHIRVEYSGTPTPLNHLASINVPGARYLIIQPWDKSILQSIEKAILKSDLGLTPSSDGNVIRLNIPPLSEERRHELVKVVHKRVEDGRIAIRNVRRVAMEELRKLEKHKEISQDELKRSLGQLQKLTDTFVASADSEGQKKEADLKEV